MKFKYSRKIKKGKISKTFPFFNNEFTLPNQKSIYLSSDTIYTDSVDKVLKDYKPEISVLACGTAQFDLFKQLIMDIDDILKFVKNSWVQLVVVTKIKRVT